MAIKVSPKLPINPIEVVFIELIAKLDIGIEVASITLQSVHAKHLASKLRAIDEKHPLPYLILLYNAQKAGVKNRLGGCVRG